MSYSAVSLSKSNLMLTVNPALTHIFSFLVFNEVDVVKTVTKCWLLQSQTWLDTTLTKQISQSHSKRILSGSLFVTSNEVGIEKTFETLAKMKKIQDGVHLGVSALHNWDYAVAMHSRYVIHLDYCPLVSHFNEKAIAILRTSNSRTEFQKALLNELTRPIYGYILNQLYEDRGSSKENAQLEITTWMQQTYSALHTDHGFRYMQKLARENSIITFTCSLQETDKLEKVAHAVKRAGLQFSSIYLSNAYDYISSSDIQDGDPEAQTQFKSSIALLKEDITCIVDATSYANVAQGITQKITHGREYIPAIEKTPALLGSL